MELPDFTSEAFVFCQVVDARPENRAKVKQGAAESSNRTTMLVQEFPRVKWLQKQAPDATVEVSKQGARTVLLDLERACSEDIFVRMMREVCVWSCETAGRQMELRGIAAEPGEVADIFEVEDARLPRSPGPATSSAAASSSSRQEALANFLQSMGAMVRAMDDPGPSGPPELPKRNS